MFFSSIYYIVSKLILIKKIEKLNVEHSGIDDENYPFIKIKNGPFFYGILSKEKEKKYYFLLSKKTKKKIPFECFGVANDIIIRYYEAGLMLGGPKKEMFYKVKQNDVIAEMGAYMGHYTIYLAQKAGKNGKVIAIEPMPDNINILRKNIEANNLSNVSIVEKGVWKEKSEMTFQRKKGDNQSGSIELNYNHEDTLNIPVDSLYNIFKKEKLTEIDFCLIQLNGIELEALKGLQKYFPKNIAIAARYSKKNENTVQLIVEFLKTNKYLTKIVKKHFIFAKLNHK